MRGIGDTVSGHSARAAADLLRELDEKGI